MFRRLDPGSELGKQVSAFITQQKEQNVAKKFTEDEYQLIISLFDGWLGDGTTLTVAIRSIAESPIFYELTEKYKYEYSFSRIKEIVILLAIHESRAWAHDQFVEKEKKYHWKYKFLDEEGDTWYLEEDSGLIVPDHSERIYSFTEKEVIEAGYNPDMYEKEEVE